MTASPPSSSESGPKFQSDWWGWLAWGWVILVVLVAVAELTGWEDLRMALDFRRHLR